MDASSRRKHYFLIINPYSGTLKSRNALFEITDVLCGAGAFVTVGITQRRGHATELALEAAREGYDLIACCGGDGTLKETITGVLQSGVDLPIGYVPAGSTNDFAANMGIPTDPRAAATALVEGKPFRMDIGSWQGNTRHYFTYIASFGAFTAASYNAPQPTKNAIGHLAYILEGMKDLQNIQPQHVRVMADGKTYEDDYIFGAVSSSTSVGGIVKLDQNYVRLDDGLFEVILVRNPKNLAELGQIISTIQTSSYGQSPMFDFFHASSVSFDTFGPLAWSLDGERADSGRLVKIDNLHLAITIMRGDWE